MSDARHGIEALTQVAPNCKDIYGFAKEQRTPIATVYELGWLLGTTIYGQTQIAKHQDNVLHAVGKPEAMVLRQLDHMITDSECTIELKASDDNYLTDHAMPFAS